MEEKKKSSPVWLIIMLCIIILLLFWIVTSAKQQQLVNSFNQEIEKLNQQIEILQKEKALEPTPNPASYFAPSSTPSASSPIKPKPKISTPSGVTR